MKFKDGVDPNDMSKMHPAALFLMSQVDLYAQVFGFDFIITSLISDHPIRPPHSDGRAFDVRVDDPITNEAVISTLHRERLIRTLNGMFYMIGAISKNSGEAVVAIDEGDHIHVQVRQDAPLINILYLA